MLGLRLRFATVSVDQFSSGSGREPDIRPILRWVARFERWPNHARCNEFVESARRTHCLCARRDQFRDHATMSRNRYTFAGFDSPDVTAQVVLELTDTSGGHDESIATCGHIWQPTRSGVVLIRSADAGMAVSRTSTCSRWTIRKASSTDAAHEHDRVRVFEERADKIAAIRIVVDDENSDGASQRVNVTCVTPLGEEVASTL